MLPEKNFFPEKSIKKLRKRLKSSKVSVCYTPDSDKKSTIENFKTNVSSI